MPRMPKLPLSPGGPQVEVFSEDTQKTFVFPCNDWLRKNGADESGLRKELVAGSPDQRGPTNYCITVHTRWGGTVP